MDGPILLVGCGRMGIALLQGWIDRGVPAASITVIEPGRQATDAASALGVSVVPEPALIPPGLMRRHSLSALDHDKILFFSCRLISI